MVSIGEDEIDEIPDCEFGRTEFLQQTCEENLTSEYDLSQFKNHYVVRRGNNVYLEVPEGSEISLRYQVLNELNAELGLNENPSTQINMVSEENQFTVPETAIPGKYQLFIDSEPKECYVYIIFNSWNSERPEFFEDEEQREQFILQESGWIDQGSNSVDRKSGRLWSFNQFDGRVLNDILMFIQCYEGLKTHEDFEKLTHPAFFTRAMTSVIYEKVLIGEWNGNYEGDYKEPLYWKSSEEIITKAMRIEASGSKNMILGKPLKIVIFRILILGKSQKIVKILIKFNDFRLFCQFGSWANWSNWALNYASACKHKKEPNMVNVGFIQL